MIRAQSPVLPAILGAIPLLRRYRQAQALADFSSTLGTGLEAGLSAAQAWRQAAAASRTAALQRACRQLQPIFAQGRDPADVLASLKQFPADFVASYRSGSAAVNLTSTFSTLAPPTRAVPTARSRRQLCSTPACCSPW